MPRKLGVSGDRGDVAIEMICATLYPGMTTLELTDEQTQVADHLEDRYPPQSTHCGTEGDPGDAAAGARARAPAPATALGAAERGSV